MNAVYGYDGDDLMSALARKDGRGEEDTRSVEVVLVGEHESTLPPGDVPVRRGPPLGRAEPVGPSLVSARWELAQALLSRWVWLVLTLGRWRR